jgi:tRNA(fMet)-specific endonuclease VapC
MKKTVLDTDILSLFLRNDINVTKNISHYLKKFHKLSFTILTYYEIVKGLTYRNSDKYLKQFIELSKYSEILPLTLKSIEISSKIYSNLRQKGITIGDVDVLIAGICLENKYSLSTNNLKHYKEIENFEIVNWLK